MRREAVTDRRGETRTQPAAASAEFPVIIKRYGIAMAAVLITVALKLLVEGLGPETHPFLLLTAAVIIASWYGGRGPGLLAMALAIASGVVFIQLGGTAIESDLVGLAALAIQAMIVVLITVGLREAQERADGAVLAAESARRELRFAVAVRDEVLRLWSRKVKGPLGELEATARAALAELRRDGYQGSAIGPLSTMLDQATLLRRATAGWTDDDALASDKLADSA